MTAGRPSLCMCSLLLMSWSGFSLLFNDIKHFELFIVDQRVDEAEYSRDTNDKRSVEGAEMVKHQCYRAHGVQRS